LENLRILKLIFVYNSVKKRVNFHEATNIVGQPYGVPHGILRVFNTILYENEFQNPQIFQQPISLFPEHSTLAAVVVVALATYYSASASKNV
jgi:hypothetical protein